MFTIYDHYWSGTRFGLYSSAREAIVDSDDAGYRAWSAAGGVASRWPRDEDGNESEQALAYVLARHGLRLQPVSLEETIKSRCAEVDAMREEKLERGVYADGQRYDADATAQLRLTSAALQAALLKQNGLSPLPVVWVTKDNVMVALDADALTEVAQVVAAYVSACVLAARRHKDALLALGSVEAVNAYDMTGGWPE